MRLPVEKVKEAILHPDQDVRSAAVYYFSRSHSTDPTIMPLVIQTVEKYGWGHAFGTHSFLEDLTQSDETIRWLVQELQRIGQPANVQEARPVRACLSALVHADPTLLKKCEAEILELEALDHETKEAINERIWFPFRTPEELWQDLEEFCQTHEQESVPDDDFDFGCRLVEALGRHRKQFSEKVVAILRGDTGDFDNALEGFAVRLAGEMRLEAAVPWLMEMLNDDSDWVHEECHRALVKIGTEAVVAAFAKGCLKGDWNFRMSAACILEDIHSDLAVQTCLDLLKSEDDTEIKSLLLHSVLMNGATEGIEPARQFILDTPLDPDVLEVRSALLVACKWMGERFPEFDAWLEDSKNDEEFRRQWYEEHPSPDDDDDEDSDEEFEEDCEEDDEEEDPAALPITFGGKEARISWSDPCPCGSGKTYKTCCYNKGQIIEKTDLGHATAMSGVRYRQVPPKYPIGTVALYGPDDKTTTKIVAGVIKREGAEPVIERWVGANIIDNPRVKQKIQKLFEQRGVQSVVETDGNMGCPHEEGEDFPTGEDCPFCPFWRGRQGTAQED